MAKAEQAQLPGTEKAQEQPLSVRGNMMLAKYVKPHYSKDKEGNYFVGLEFSFPLNDAHKKLLPADLVHSWNAIKSGRNGRKILDIDVPPQSVNIHLAPDDGAHLSLVYATISAASLEMIEETGSGQAQDVIRYKFRVDHPADGPANSDLREFADLKFDSSVWLQMSEVQSKLA